MKPNSDSEEACIPQLMVKWVEVNKVNGFLFPSIFCLCGFSEALKSEKVDKKA